MYLYANLVGLLIDALRADCMGCVLVYSGRCKDIDWSLICWPWSWEHMM